MSKNIFLRYLFFIIYINNIPLSIFSADSFHNELLDTNKKKIGKNIKIVCSVGGGISAAILFGILSKRYSQNSSLKIGIQSTFVGFISSFSFLLMPFYDQKKNMHGQNKNSRCFKNCSFESLDINQEENKLYLNKGNLFRSNKIQSDNNELYQDNYRSKLPNKNQKVRNIDQTQLRNCHILKRTRNKFLLSKLITKLIKIKKNLKKKQDKGEFNNSQESYFKSSLKQVVSPTNKTNTTNETNKNYSSDVKVSDFNYNFEEKIAELKEKNSRLEEENSSLKQKNSELEKKYTELQTAGQNELNRFKDELKQLQFDKDI